MLDPFVAERPGDIERLRDLQEDIHDQFKQYVLTRRGEKLKADEDVLFSGEFWTGRRAEELGLIDGLGDLRSVMRELYGAKVNLKVVDAPRRFGLQRFLGSRNDYVEQAIAAVEERISWGRFGL